MEAFIGSAWQTKLFNNLCKVYIKTHKQNSGMGEFLLMNKKLILIVNKIVDEHVHKIWSFDRKMGEPVILTQKDKIILEMACMLFGLDNEKTHEDMKLNAAHDVLSKMWKEIHDELGPVAGKELSILQEIFTNDTLELLGSIDPISNFNDDIFADSYPGLQSILTYGVRILGSDFQTFYNMHKRLPVFMSDVPRFETIEDIERLLHKWRFAQYKKKKISISLVDHCFDKVLHLTTISDIRYPYKCYPYNCVIDMLKANRKIVLDFLVGLSEASDHMLSLNSNHTSGYYIDNFLAMLDK